MNLDSLFNNLLTSGIKLSDPETIRKFRILNIFQLIFIVMAPLLGLFYYYIGAILLFYTTTIAGLAMISAIILLKKTKNTVFVGNYAIFILWATLFILSWNTGAITYDGVIKPSWILNGGLILLTIFLNGYLSATIWATVVFVETGVVIYLFRTGYLFPNLIPPEIAAIYSLGTYLIALLTMLLFAFLFEKEKDDALKREQEKSRALRDSKRYTDDLLERSPIPTFILNKNHRVIQWNRACRDMTGVSSEEIFGKEVWEGFAIDDQGSMADIILEGPETIVDKYGDFIISQKETGWFELEMALPKIKRGIRAVIYVGPILDNNGEVRGAIQTIQEIREHQTEKGVTQNSSLGQVEESLANPIFKVDSQGKISFWNRACEENFGYSSEQILRKNALSLLSKRYRPIFRKTLIKVFKGESFNDKEWKYYTSEGEPVYMLAKGYQLQSADGGAKECVIINTNITDLKLKLKKLQLYAAESKEKLKNLTEEYNLLKKNIATFIRKKE